MLLRVVAISLTLIACRDRARPAPSSGAPSAPGAPLLMPGQPLAARPVPPIPRAVTDPAIELVASGTLTCALLTSGEVSCWGDEHVGPHRVPGITDAVHLGLLGRRVFVVRRDGQLASTTSDPGARLERVRGAKDVVQIVTSSDALCVRDRTGGVACWVEGGPLELVGVRDLAHARALVMGTQEDPEWRSPHVTFGCAIVDAGRVACFDLFRQLDADETTARPGAPRPVRIGRARTLRALASVDEIIVPADPHRICGRAGAGPYACVSPGSPDAPLEPDPEHDGAIARAGRCVARAPDAVTCHQELQPESTVHVPGLLQLVDGDDHACALITGGRVVCWGSNERGGLGSLVPPPPPDEAVDVAGLADATDLAPWARGALAVRANGQIAYWGTKAGDGHDASIDIPTTFSTITDALRVFSNRKVACVVRRAGPVACWGHWGDWELEQGTPLAPATPTEIPAFAGARTLRFGDDGMIATLADGRVLHLGDTRLGPSSAARPAPFPGGEHAVDALVVDRWVCLRDRTPGPVTCHAETHDWVTASIRLDVPDVVEMAGVPPRNVTSAPRKLIGPFDGPDQGLAFPSAFVALRRADGRVVDAHLTIDAGAPHAALTPLTPHASRLFTTQLALCAVGDTVTCHSDEHDDWIPEHWTPPAVLRELASAWAFTLGDPTCLLRANGHVACLGDRSSPGFVASRGLGNAMSEVPVPVEP